MFSARAFRQLYVIHSHVARNEFLLIHQADFTFRFVSNRKVWHPLPPCFLLQSTRPNLVKYAISGRATKVEVLIFILVPVLPPQQEDLVMRRCLSGVAAG